MNRPFNRFYNNKHLCICNFILRSFLLYSTLKFKNNQSMDVFFQNHFFFQEQSPEPKKILSLYRILDNYLVFLLCKAMQ